MADISYNIEANLKLSGAGQFQGGMTSAAKAAEQLQSSLNQAWGGAKALGGGLLSAAEQGMAMAARLASVGLAAGTALGGAMAHGIGSNLKELEDKSIQLSAVMAAAMGTSFKAAQGESRELFAQFKNDAVQSAGETKDFVNIASMITGPVLGAGASMKELHDLTRMTVEASQPLGVSFEQAGSDVMRMLQGVAGSEQALFRAMVAIPSLGITKAEEFNKLSGPERLAKVKAALGNEAFRSAAEAAGSSMAGLTSTLQDQLKTMGGMIGGPLYESIKGALARVTGGVGKALEPGSDLGRSLTAMGAMFSYRFEEIFAAIRRIFPTLGGNAESTIDRITDALDFGLGKVALLTERLADHWPEIVDGAKRFGSALEHAVERAEALLSTLGGGDMAKGLERAAELYGGAKTAGALAPMAGGAYDLGKGLYGAASALPGLFGGGATAAGAAGAAGAEAGAAGASGAASLAAAGGMGATAAGAGAAAAALAVLGASLLAVKDDTLGVFGWLGEQWQHVQESLEPLRPTFAVLQASMGNLWDSMVRLARAVEPLVATLATIPMAPFIAALKVAFDLIENGALLVGAFADQLTKIAMVGAEAADSLAQMLHVINKKLGIAPTLSAADPEKHMPYAITPMGAKFDLARSAPSVEREHWRPGDKPAGKLEVTIKWDLGDGDDAAIYVRNRQQIRETLQKARGQVRGGRVPGMF